jgi:hypothetical protein
MVAGPAPEHARQEHDGVGEDDWDRVVLMISNRSAVFGVASGMASSLARN